MRFARRVTSPARTRYTCSGRNRFWTNGVPIETATLPAGWEQRVIVVSNRNTRMKAGLCLEAHDLTASKLAAFREKDRDFVRVLLAERLVKNSD